MSIQATTTLIQTDNLVELEELADSLEEKLTHYGKRHKDFSVVIEKDYIDNVVIVKTLFLEEHVN